jgi:hypothetical protein
VSDEFGRAQFGSGGILVKGHNKHVSEGTEENLSKDSISLTAEIQTANLMIMNYFLLS